MLSDANMGKPTLSWKRSVLLTCFLVTSSAASAEQAIELESTFVGDREQPSVSYFIPWKPPEGPDKLYRPIKSISGNILDPVDREVLSRSIQFYDELALETAGGSE